MPQDKKPSPRLQGKTGDTRPANPADFGKKTSPVRERLAEQVKKMPPAERIKKGP